MPVVMDADRVGRTLTRIAHEILERTVVPDGDSVYLASSLSDSASFLTRSA